MQNLQPDHSWFRQPLWLVGFRPFFLLTFALGLGLPLLWVAMMRGWVDFSPASLTPMQWHGHEMFYGFGWALLGGFLLTASKNWVKIRGLHGDGLALLVGFWFLERLTLAWASPEHWWFWLGANLYLVSVVGYLLYCLIRFRAQDDYSDNFYFWMALPAFVVAKNLMLLPQYYSAGLAMTLGLFRVAFAVMFERTMMQFMKHAMNTPLPNWPWLSHSIKGLMLLAVAVPWVPPIWGVALLWGAAAALLLRFCFWKPQVGFRTFGIGIMYAGYLGLVLHLVLEGWNLWQGGLGMGALSLHVFTFGCMGMIIPSMMVRISQGHTGRKPIFVGTDRLALGLMAMAGVSRLVLTQIWPGLYVTWIALAGVGWALCFGILALRLAPMLWQARIDGKEH